MLKKFILPLALLCVFSITQAVAGNCIKWPTSAFQPQTDAQGKLMPDTGIYWYNTNIDNSGNSEQVKHACHTDDEADKAACMQKLQSAGYFDPHKPTIIFVHGWQPGATENRQRFDFCYQFPMPQNTFSLVHNTLQYWQGWNVGVFYWTQFADESNLLSAEAKIYTPYGKEGMRWSYINKQGNVAYCSSAKECEMPKLANGQPANVFDMLTQAYRQALPSPADYKGAELRIAGQSLGTQLATQLTDYVLLHKDLPQPTRLSLMDPYMSPSGMGTKTQGIPYSISYYNTGKVLNIEWLKAGKFPIDVYRTSRLSFFPSGNPANILMNNVAYMALYPKYFDQTVTGLQKQALLHISSIYLYFESMKAPPKKALPGKTYDYVNAAATNAEVLRLMKQKRYQLANIAEKYFDLTQDEQFGATKPAKKPTAVTTDYRRLLFSGGKASSLFLLK